MVVYSTTEDLSDDEIIARGIRDGAVLTSQVINRVDSDTAAAREAKRKKELEAYQRLQKEQSARLELEEKRQIERARLRNQQDLVAAGFAEYGRWPNPNEILWDLHRNECCFGCDEKVRYAYEKSPGLSNRDSLTLPYSLDKKEFHLCKNLPKEQRAIFQNIIRMIFDLRIALLTAQEQSSGFGRMAAESNLVSLR